MNSKKVRSKRSYSNQNSVTTRLKEYLPIGTVILIFWGLTEEYMKYRPFNLRITSYLESSEILLLFFNNVLDLISAFIIGVILHIIIWTPFEKRISKNNLFAIFPVTFALLLVVSAGYVTYDVGPQEFIVYILGFLLPALIDSGHLKNNNNGSFLLMLVLVIISVFFLLEPTKEEILSKNIRAKIFLKTDTVETGENLRWLGDTRNYIFLFDTSTNQTTVLKKELVNSMLVDSDSTLRMYDMIFRAPGAFFDYFLENEDKE